jgi:MoaA/NifB/PqqE/SkfB family radical SAM enzyme
VVLELLEKPLLREELGKKARRFASARDWSAIATSLQTVYQGKCQDFIARPSIEAHLPPRIPSKPLTLLLLINRGCNLRCAFCDLWQNPENMPYERVLKLLQEAVLIGTKTLVITGGEPTLHPDLPRIVQEARKMGLAVNITTNGTLLDRHYEPLKKAGVSSLSFSIDGTADTHDRLRGQKGAFERTWTQLVRARLDGMDCSVYFTVTRENVRELLPIYQKVQALGSRFDFWPVNDAPALYLRPEDKEAWEAAVSTIGATDPAVAAKAHYYQKAFAYHTGLGGKMRCLGLVDQYGVTFKGELLPCCVWGGEGLKVGNVFKTPLSTLWHSKSIQAFREHLYRDGCAVGCYNHSLYEFTASTGESHQVGKEYVGKSPV